jgi:hypothetical protein
MLSSRRRRGLVGSRLCRRRARRCPQAIVAQLLRASPAEPWEKHVASIFGKLGLPSDEADSRRVLAVLHYLGA